MKRTLIPFMIVSALSATEVHAAPFFFNSGDPDFKIASGSQPGVNGKIEIESADDFILNNNTAINHASFTGLITSNAILADIKNVDVEIYRVFSKDSVNPPSGNVPTRVNSPADIAFDSRDSANKTLSFSVSDLNDSVTVANSVFNGINKIPNQKTGGEGPVTGMEVKFNVDFSTPFSLAADHYFFVPQVELTNGAFLWLSSPKPITGGTGPFTPDLQAWIRNENLAPDWLRIGTDIVGAGAFNESFSLNGEASIPLPGTIWLVLSGVIGLLGGRRQRLSA